MPPLNNEDWEVVTPPVETPEAPIPEAPIPEDNSDIDTILDSLLKEDEVTTPTEPTFPKEEEKKDNVDDFIDESFLDDLDASFADLETQLEEKDKAITEKEKALLDETNKTEALSEALDKLWEHPILWPLNEKILKWEKVDIPEYLQKSLQEDLESLPNMDENTHEPSWIKEPELLQDKIARIAQQRH